MTETIANLTLTAVMEQIEAFLKNHPDQTYQQAFSHPELRQKLIADVMSRIRGSQVVVDDQNADLSPQKIHTTEERLQMEALIREGIERISQEQADREGVERIAPAQACCSDQSSQTDQSAVTPSRWFG
jgi:hypothetical protein